MTQRETDIDDELLARAMEALGTSSVDETVNAVLRIAAKLDREPEQVRRKVVRPFRHQG